MAISHTIAIVALAAVGAYGALKPKAQTQHVPSFSQLKPGEVVEMNFRSSGCFRTSQYDLKFTRASDLSVNVTSIERSTGKDGKPVLHTHPLGNLKLSSKDAGGLDALIDFYRSKPKGGCTTVDTAVLTYRRGSETLAREMFKDGSCSYRLPGAVRVTDLVARFDQKNKSR